MFTGLIADVGTVVDADRGGGGARLRVRTRLAAELSQGDSIAVNGACLTAVSADGRAFEADVMNQTLDSTALGAIEIGDGVNLELALRAADRLGGHHVQGHVDAAVEIRDAAEDGIARRLSVGVPADLRRYVVERGSVALDGVSLTIASVDDRGFEVSLVPETLRRTTLGRAAAGSTLNLEVDVLARYAESLMSELDVKETRE